MKRSLLCMVLALAGCNESLLDDDGGTDSGTSGSTGSTNPGGVPQLTAPCRLDPPVTTLALTTTDFATGSVTIVDTRNRSVTADVALGTTDGIPFWYEGRLYVVHRFGHDFVDILAPGAPSWNSLGQHAIESEDTSAPNPHSIAFASDGLAYVPLFGAGTVRILDLTESPGESSVGDVDLSAFADDDGNPEPSLAISCGDVVYVSVQRLDPSFAVVGPDALVPIRTSTREAVDVDAFTEGAQGISVNGTWIRQVRRDPADGSAHTILALTTGIERIDLATGQVTWAVRPEIFAVANIDSYLQLLSFDVDANGEFAYVAAYGPGDPGIDCASSPGDCFETATLHRIRLDDPNATLEPFATDFDAVERTLEVVGTELWFGSTRSGEAGLWYYDVSSDPPTPLGGPLATGLPPYSMTTIDLP